MVQIQLPVYITMWQEKNMQFNYDTCDININIFQSYRLSTNGGVNPLKQREHKLTYKKRELWKASQHILHASLLLQFKCICKRVLGDMGCKTNIIIKSNINPIIHKVHEDFKICFTDYQMQYLHHRVSCQFLTRAYQVILSVQNYYTKF